MKRYLLVLLVVIFVPVQVANTQALAFDAIIASATQGTLAEQIAGWIMLAKEMGIQIKHLGDTVENTGKTYLRAMDNLKGAGDIKSWSDFTDWYSRQQYLTRTAMETFKGMNVSIGGKAYLLSDIEGMAHGLTDTYIEYWNREFTEAQRREMWLALGLTPANYAYRKTFNTKEMEKAREFIALAQVQNNEYKKNMERNKERLDRMSTDKLLDNEAFDKMTEKELLMYAVESLMETNKVLNDMAVYQTMEMEMQGIQSYLNQGLINDAPVLSEWLQDGFRPLSSVRRGR